MRNFKLKIADYNIGFEASATGPDLAISPKFLRYISYDTKVDVHIKIHSGGPDLPAGAERVFHAPFMCGLLCMSTILGHWHIKSSRHGHVLSLQRSSIYAPCFCRATSITVKRQVHV